MVKGAQTLIYCFKEVSLESYPARDIHTAVSKCLRFVTTASITP